MDKVEKILERYKIYLGVRDVVVEIRPYKTRDAFTNLTSSPPIIYLNKHLIDDEEILEYLILREMIHIAFHKYPQLRYGTPNLSHSNKFDSALRFFVPKEKEEKINKEDREKTDRGKPETRSITSFSSFVGPSGTAPCSADGAPPEGCRGQNKRKKRLIRLQVFPHRTFLTGIIIPVSLYLWGSTCKCWILRPFRHTAGRLLLPPPRGISRQV
jgi:hypothetical protein